MDAKDELERLQKQNAAMREALERYAPKTGAWDSQCALCGAGVPHGEVKHNANCPFAVGLKPDAGARYLSPEQVRPLVDCLAHIKTLALECREKPEIVLSAVGLSACSGVGHAKSLGL